MVCVMPSRLNRSSAQKRTQSNFRFVASSNRAGKLLPLFRALPAALVIDVLTADCMAGVDYPVPQLSWPLSSADTLA